ncbi:MAG: hypothetical protein H6732_07260 [Alphaproteobacteria bacterium]|nr:hypothetical protein [Alphaproteobacteria bacterium]
MPVRPGRRGVASTLVTLSACLAGQPVDGDTDATPTGPHAALVTTLPVPVGDPACPAGGVRLRTGIDDGRDGGTADDGELQDGEVRTDDLLCNGVSAPDDTDVADTGATPSDFLPLGPLAGPPGEGVIRGLGGESTSGEGALGATVSVLVSQTPAYGQLVMSRTGTVDTSFTLPTWPAPILGDQPLLVDTDLVVPELAAGAPRDPGQLYTAPGQLGLFRWQGSGPSLVSSLQIREGATLTLLPGVDGAVAASFSGDVRIDGRLSLGENDDGRVGTLVMQAAGFVLGSTGYLDLKGADRTGDVNGQAGGLLTVEVAGQFAGKSTAASTFAVLGTLDTRGGDGLRGGVAGTATFRSSSLGVLAGTILGTGGAALGGGSNGTGSKIELDVAQGPVLVDVDADLRGGAGDGLGGQGGSLILQASWARVHGTVRADGGAAGACPVLSCSGGRGGAFRLFAFDGPVHVDLDLSARGAAGSGPEATGGVGGSFEIDTANGFAPGAPQLPRELLVAGNIDVSGGRGVVSGALAGSVSIRGGSRGDTRSVVALVGYDRLELDGGPGRSKGGNGGSLQLETTSIDGETKVGGVYADPTVLARGGTGAQGGFGGRVGLTLGAASGDDLPERAVRWAGTADLRGGAGTTLGGGGGQLSLSGPFEVRVEGEVDARGGDGLSGATTAGKGGRGLSAAHGATVRSLRGLVHVGAPLRFGGGTGGRTGGGGGTVLVEGRRVAVAALIGVEGADGVDGGDGGRIFVSSLGLDSDVVAATFDVAPGDGPGDLGEPGRVYVDGFDVTASWWSP